MIAAVYARKSTEQNGVGDEEKSVTRQVDQSGSIGEHFLDTRLQHDFRDLTTSTDKQWKTTVAIKVRRAKQLKMTRRTYQWPTS